MHTQWLRAFRRTAPLLRVLPRRLPLTAIRPLPPRYLHATAAALRAAAAAPDGSSSTGDNSDGNNAPRQEDEVTSNNNHDPEKEKDKEKEKECLTDGQNVVDENIFGETTTTLSGDGQGRKKRAGNASLRSRTQRNRTPEELPPVHLPKDFPATAVSRVGDAQAVHEKAVRVFRGLLGDPELSRSISDHFDGLARAAQAISGRSHAVHRSADAVVALAYWRAVYVMYELQGPDAAAKFLETHPAPWSADMSFLSCIPGSSLEGASLETKHDLKAALETALGQKIEKSVLAGLHPVFLEEITATLTADFAVEAPKKVKIKDLRRPVTVINTAYCRGFSAAKTIVRHIAAELDADVLHLRAHDIAHVIGTYLGQDVARASSPISHLAYKAAEISGRSLSLNLDDKNEEDSMLIPYTQGLRDEKLRRDSKKSVMTMDEFLNGTSRAKSGELWEDLKINSVLEELVHAADSEGDEQRPLLIHIDDYNAINLDLEAGSTIIGKIRKVVDGLWADGRKIALVGTCSSKDAPKAYVDGLKEVASSERLMNLYVDPALPSPGEKRDLKKIEEFDYLEENERNITDVLLAMVKPGLDDSAISRARGLSLKTDPFNIESIKDWVPETWIKHVLPLAETYRIATTMIGLRGSDVFNKDALKDAAILIKRIDEAKERLNSRETDSEGQSQISRGLLSSLRKKEHGAEHEEQLLSGLVNAKDIRTTFDMIHAPKETIESIRMLTTLSLIRPEAFSYGVLATERIPGCLLYGPPGTGKTLLAKAVAKESGANMIEVSAATINNMYVGESEKMVRALFRLARKKEPLVIFIDEADALLGARGQQRDRSGSREVINQFLREWDGVDNARAFILVATNRPFDLDEAVLRRLPRKLLVDLPRERDRTAILRIHLRDEQLGDGVDLGDLARRTPLYSGSDLKNVCVAAAMAAVKEELVDPATGVLSLEPGRNSDNNNNSNHHPANPTANDQDENIKGREEEEEEEDEKEDKKQNPQLRRTRTLHPRHFDAALKEIGASVSEDMQTLSAIRRFDERYGDSVTAGGGANRRNRRRGMGFEVVPEARDGDGARVRVDVSKDGDGDGR